ncbi:MAG TPA: hypothetical protein PKL71_01425, partial [Marmoricola sp.]|nr:hypothetical protein [Marmoricola sp.]
ELTWESVRGARNQARLWVEPAGADESLVHVVLKFHLDGGILARAAMLLARGILTRHVEAGLENMRHKLEFGD